MSVDEEGNRKCAVSVCSVFWFQVRSFVFAVYNIKRLALITFTEVTERLWGCTDFASWVKYARVDLYYRERVGFSQCGKNRQSLLSRVM